MPKNLLVHSNRWTKCTVTLMSQVAVYAPAERPEGLLTLLYPYLLCDFIARKKRKKVNIR
jgi:hypothetical protein